VVVALLLLSSITGWLWGAALATAVGTVLLAWNSDIRSSLNLSLDFSLIRRMAVFGFPLIGWALAHNLLNFSDRFIIEFFRGSGAVGIYSSNYALAAQAAGITFGPVIQAIHPIVMNDWDGNDTDKLVESIKRYSRYLLILGAPVIAFSIALSRSLTGILLAPEYAAGYLVVPFVTIGLFLWNFANIGHKSLEVAEQSMIMLIGVVISLTVNLILNIPLVINYGYLGAAIASLIGFGVYPVYVYFATRRNIPWKIPWKKGAIVFASTTAILIPYAIVHSLVPTRLGIDLLLVIPTGVLYFGVIVLAGVVPPSELNQARIFIQNITE
jgi:O-antigen/teichoic acid export membrane protein